MGDFNENIRVDITKGIDGLEVNSLAVRISDSAGLVYADLPKSFRFNLRAQLLNADDTVGVNIAEGNGRFHYKEAINFHNYARGSAFETQHWLNLILKRELVNPQLFNELNNLIEFEIKKINVYNNHLKSKLANDG